MHFFIRINLQKDSCTEVLSVIICLLIQMEKIIEYFVKKFLWKKICWFAECTNTYFFMLTCEDIFLYFHHMLLVVKVFLALSFYSNVFLFYHNKQNIKENISHLFNYCIRLRRKKIITRNKNCLLGKLTDIVIY